MSAIRRTFGYYTGANRMVLLHPADCGRQDIGHFNLFHKSNEQGFWYES